MKCYRTLSDSSTAAPFWHFIVKIQTFGSCSLEEKLRPLHHRQARWTAVPTTVMADDRTREQKRVNPGDIHEDALSSEGREANDEGQSSCSRKTPEISRSGGERAETWARQSHPPSPHQTGEAVPLLPALPPQISSPCCRRGCVTLDFRA